jgi:hypothetical protein
MVLGNGLSFDVMTPDIYRENKVAAHMVVLYDHGSGSQHSWVLMERVNLPTYSSLFRLSIRDPYSLAASALPDQGKYSGSGASQYISSSSGK